MDLKTIPELLNFFHNTEVEHLAHRHWILEVIRDGMKTDFDMELALRCVVFKIFQGFYSSVLADPVTKVSASYSYRLYLIISVRGIFLSH